MVLARLGGFLLSSFGSIQIHINRFWYKDDLGKEACHITERRLLMCVSNLGNGESRVDNNDEEDDWCHCCFVIGSLRFWDDGSLFTPHPTRRSLELCGVTIYRTYFLLQMFRLSFKKGRGPKKAENKWEVVWSSAQVHLTVFWHKPDPVSPTLANCWERQHSPSPNLDLFV